MTITRDDIRPLEDAVTELLCLQSAWREAGGPAEEPSAYFYGRFFDGVEGLHGAFNETLGKLSGAAKEAEAITPRPLTGEDIEKLQAARELLEAETQGKTGGCAYGALVVIRELLDGTEAEASEPKLGGSDGDNAVYAEIRRRMDELENSYKNAPKITAGRLDGWQDHTRVISRLVYGARETVDLLNRSALEGANSFSGEERDSASFYGPLCLVQDALDKAEDELAGLCMGLGDAKRQEVA